MTLAARETETPRVAASTVDVVATGSALGAEVRGVDLKHLDDAAFAGLGLGVALKVDDGATRASEAMMGAIVARLLPEHEETTRRWTNAPVVTRRGAKVGEVRALAAAFQARA